MPKKDENAELIKQKKRVVLYTSILSGLMLTLLVVFIFAGFARIEIDTSGSCTSGKINLSVEGYNTIQSYPCYEKWFYDNVTLPDNTTTKVLAYNYSKSHFPDIKCFKEDFMLNHAKLKQIDGLECEGKAKIKMPMIMAWFIGGD